MNMTKGLLRRNLRSHSEIRRLLRWRCLCLGLAHIGNGRDNQTPGINQESNNSPAQFRAMMVRPPQQLTHCDGLSVSAEATCIVLLKWHFGGAV